jgi:hypothetical protein
MQEMLDCADEALAVSGVIGQFPPTCSEELAREIHGAQLIFFERSGHYPFIEEPEAFWSAVASFLAARRTTNEQVSEATRQRVGHTSCNTDYDAAKCKSKLCQNCVTYSPKHR